MESEGRLGLYKGGEGGGVPISKSFDIAATLDGVSESDSQWLPLLSKNTKVQNSSTNEID